VIPVSGLKAVFVMFRRGKDIHQITSSSPLVRVSFFSYWIIPDSASPLSQYTKQMRPKSRTYLPSLFFATIQIRLALPPD
jgi:hypothetical protein